MKGIEAHDAREHPALAVRAEIMIEGRSVHTALHRLSLHDTKRFGGNHRRQRERARAHALTAPAMTGSRQHGRRRDLDAQRPTAAVAHVWEVEQRHGTHRMW